MRNINKLQTGLILLIIGCVLFGCLSTVSATDDDGDWVVTSTSSSDSNGGMDIIDVYTIPEDIDWAFDDFRDYLTNHVYVIQ